jgi:serine/threonine protein kinase
VVSWGKSDDVPAVWQKGDVIAGLYEVRGLLGQGGMGVVYKVHHRGWDLDIAVKSPKANVFAHAKGAEFFEHECEMWVNLGLHPNIVSCYYVRRLGGLPRVFAEYVAGGTLSQWIRRGLLYRGEDGEVLTRILDIARQMAWGLHYAHQQGLVNQDVKPMNVLLTEDGVAKVTDFGLAKAMALASADEAAQRSAPTGSWGTLLYSSPEQSRREELSCHTDIWSWAVSVLEMFVGEVTWMAGATADRALEGYLELGPEETRIPAMPEPLVGLLRDCLSQDVGKRPGDMGEVAARLQDAYRETTGQPYPREAPEAEASSTAHMNNRAVSLVDLGKIGEAEKLWSQALQDDPRHLQSTYNRALNQWRQGRIIDVTMIQTVRELCAATPQSWLPLYMLAKVHLERGDSAKAAEILKRLKSTDVGGHEVNHWLATATHLLPQTRDIVATFGPYPDGVTAVALSWDGCLGLAGGGGTTAPAQLMLWNVLTGECRQRFLGHGGQVTVVGFSADGLSVLSGHSDGTLRLWEVGTAVCQRAVGGHKGPVRAASLTGSGRCIVSAGGDGLLRAWDVMTGKCVQTISAHDGPVNAAQLCSFEKRVLTAGQDGLLRLWELESGRRIKEFEGPKSPLTAMCLSSDQRYAVTGSADGHMRLWDVAKGECRREFRCHNAPVAAVSVSKDMRHALTAGEGTLRLWDVRVPRCIHTFKGQPPISLSADGEHAISGSEDGALCLWAARCNIASPRAPMLLCHAGQ